ncbi:TadE/TadG family type IV pilus assembly protein [Ideonella sp.]|uniref:TadE/TadG family type IV pilus assembly protein n=1 Tax=Ideonella sp. TaxID=1929293 RepID=UPI002B495C68|nr:TadE/TadG family type IV pilus assembly protein [Ideonella sp.]HJV70292.1 TadE/TadG family type IV pilus assembly protein [Ideonella sp.]
MNGVICRSDQRGQSMVEFLVALAVLLPLFLAVSYAGRYSDVQQSAVQASRYAAFQRAMQPNGTPSDNTLRDQMRARFFLYGGRNNGRLQSDDTAVNANGTDAPPLWHDLSGTRLLNSPNDVSLTFGTTNLNLAAAGRFMNVMTSSAGKTYRPATVAQVEVTLANKLDLSTSSPSPLKIAAATATAGDGLGSSGSRGTRDAAATVVPLARLPSGLRGGLSFIMGLFEPAGPELGCIKPDVVPNNRLSPYASPEGCM